VHNVQDRELRRAAGHTTQLAVEDLSYECESGKRAVMVNDAKLFR